MQVVILCGGMGTRIREVSELVPKPMLRIGEFPIVWHIMKYFASFGHNEFVLCLGFKKEAFIDYFINYWYRNSDIKVDLDKNEVKFFDSHDERSWSIVLADTGLATNTGGRIRRIEQYIESDNFFMTYGDGVTNVDLNGLVDFHKSKGKTATVTAVHPSSRFGEIKIRDDIVEAFDEKPQTSQGYINGGYMVLNRNIFSYLNEDPNLDFESTVMKNLAAARELCAFKHDDFWQCMDTSREYQFLNRVWSDGEVPWKTW